MPTRRSPSINFAGRDPGWREESGKDPDGATFTRWVQREPTFPQYTVSDTPKHDGTHEVEIELAWPYRQVVPV